jgi:hypothetical protein
VTAPVESGEKEQKDKGKKDFLTSTSCNHGALHQQKDDCDPKTKGGLN